MVGLCMLFLVDCSVTMIQVHGWAFYEGDQVQQDREGLHHSKIDLVWVSQTGGKHIVVCFKHNFKYLDKCLSTSTSISAFIDPMLEALLQALPKCLKHKYIDNQY